MLLQIGLLHFFILLPSYFIALPLNIDNGDDLAIEQTEATSCENNSTELLTEYSNSDCYLINGMCSCVENYNFNLTLTHGEEGLEVEKEMYANETSTYGSMPPSKIEGIPTSSPLKKFSPADKPNYGNNASSSSVPSPSDILITTSAHLSTNPIEYLPLFTTETTLVMSDGLLFMDKSVNGPKQEYPWPVKREAVVEGDLIIGGLMMVHEREDTITCGPIMPQGGVQALETMLYTIDQINANKSVVLPNITIGAHVLDDCDKDTYGLEMAVDFIKGSFRRFVE